MKPAAYQPFKYMLEEQFRRADGSRNFFRSVFARTNVQAREFVLNWIRFYGLDLGRRFVRCAREMAK